MNLLIQLRQICDQYVHIQRVLECTDRLRHSPYLLPDVEPDPFINGEHVVASSSKLIAIDKILADILPKGERVLIFSVRSSSLLVHRHHANLLAMQQWTGCVCYG